MSATPDGEARRGPGAGDWIKLAVSAALGVGLLVLVFRGVEWDGVVRSFELVRPGWLVLSLLLYLCTHASRGWRLQLLLRPVKALRFRVVYSIQSVGLLAIQGLPLRLGEVVRPYLLLDRGKVPLGSGTYLIVAERALDMIALAGLLALVAFGAQLPDQTLRIGEWEVQLVDEGRKALLITLAPVLTFLALLAVLRDRAVRWTRAVFSLAHRGLADRLARFVETFIAGLRATGRGRPAAEAAGSTLLVWAVNILAMVALCRAFGLDAIGLPEGAALLLILILGLLLPAPPFAAGLMEAMLIAGLTLFAVEREPATAVAMMHRVINLVVVGGLGVGFLLVDKVSLGPLLRRSRSTGEDS